VPYQSDRAPDPSALHRRLSRADLRLFRRIAGWRSTPLWQLKPKPPTPLERLMGFLSRSANLSQIWFATSAVLFKFGGRSGKRAAIRGIGSIAVTSPIVNFLLKPLIKRKRPARDHVPAARRLIRQPLTTSFPSGHSASAFAFATGVSLEKPRAGLAIAPLAAGVAYSRTFNGVHYPFDVAAGSAIGAGLALAGRRVWPDLPSAEEAAVELPARREAPAIPDGEGVAIVVNPESGSGLDVTRPSADDLRALLPAARVIELSEDDDPAEVARAAASEVPVLGVCGGDGTLAGAAQVALETGKPLLVIPGGTMNHLAHDLGIREAEDATAALAGGEAVEIDVATVDGRVFVNSASLGAHTAMIDARRELEGRVGRWPAQVLAAFKSLRDADPVEVTINGERHSVWMAFIGNGRYHDRGLAPGWRRSLDDGHLDVRILDASRHRSRLRALLTLLFSGPRRSRGIETRHLPRLTIESLDGSVRVSRDGETFEAAGPVSAESHRRALLVYAPNRG